MIKIIEAKLIDKDFLNNTKYISDKCNTNFRDILVNKPWGEEYLLYENEHCAVWILNIKYMQNTSMHCHVEKDTSLVCLDGQVSCSTLSTNDILNPLHSLFLQKGVFHQTSSISKDGSYILEIETPVNKFDLVRINDNYGRRGKDYEDKQHYRDIEKLTLDSKQNSCKSVNSTIIEIICNDKNFDKSRYVQTSLISILSKSEFIGKIFYLKDFDIGSIENNAIIMIISPADA